jgi:DNA-binding transcriptional MerR regulator
MLSINEICDQAGITIHTLQSWRRNGLNLLPKPVAVDKKVIFFDDSILERIRLIREHKAAGRRIVEISALFESYGTVAENLAVNGDEAERKFTALADMLAQLAVRETALQTLLDEHRRHTRELFQNFQKVLIGAADALPNDGDM